MSKDRLRAHALKKIVNSPGCSIEAEVLLEGLKKIDRTCNDLVLSKFIPVISTIPLIETNGTTFSLTKSAAKRRSYYMMLTLLFGNRAVSQWPDVDKLLSWGIPKTNNVKLAHFINSYCVQTMPQDKLASYNAQMSMLIDFVIKSGKAKEILYDKLIMELIVPYFPTLSLNWIVLFNVVVKEPRPSNLVQSSLTTEKAVSLLTKLIRKVARDCEMELNRPTTQTANVTSMNYADVAKDTSRAPARTRQTSVPSPEKISEGVPIPAEMFHLITGENGSGLREIHAETGAIVTVGSTRNGVSAFLVTGTPDQNSRAIEKIFSMVYKDENEVKKFDNTESIITYASDILRKFMGDKEWARKLVMLSMLDAHIHCVINVEPSNQQVLVKGPHREREPLTEAVRDLLSDFAADLIKRGRAPPKANQAEVPSTQLFSLGSEHNVLIRANTEKILAIANIFHVSLTFPGSSQKNILTLSGRKKNIKEADQAISALLKSEADLAEHAVAALLEIVKDVKKTSPKTSPKISTADLNTKGNKIAENTPIDWENIETSSSKNDYWYDSKDDGTVCERFEDMGLSADILTALYNNGFKAPSYLLSRVLMTAMLGGDVLIQCPHSLDLLSTLIICLLQTLDITLAETQVLFLVSNKDHLGDVKRLVDLLGEYDKLNCHISFDSKDEPLLSPLVIVSMLTRVKELIDNELLDPNYVKLIIVLDADVKVGFTGYKEFQLELTSVVQASSEPQVIIHSSSLSKRLKDIVSEVMKHVYEVEVKEEQLQNVVPILFDKQTTKTIPSNIPVFDALLLKMNMHLVQDIMTEHDITLEFDKDGHLSLNGKCVRSLNTALSKITHTLAEYQKIQSDKLDSIVCVLSPIENTYIYQNRQVVAEIVKGYNVEVKYGHFESDNLELHGKVSSINTVSKLISEAVKHHVSKTHPGGNFAEFFKGTPVPKTARKNSDKDLAAVLQEGQSKVNMPSKQINDMAATPPGTNPYPASTSGTLEHPPVLLKDVIPTSTKQSNATLPVTESITPTSTKQSNAKLPVSESDKSELVDPTQPTNPFDYTSPNSKRKIKQAKSHLNREPKIEKQSPKAQPQINCALSELQNLQSKASLPQSPTISTPSFEIVENGHDENSSNNMPSMPTALEPIRAPHERPEPMFPNPVCNTLTIGPADPHSIPKTPEPLRDQCEIPKRVNSPQIGKYVPPGLRDTTTPVKLHEPGFTTVESSRIAYLPPSLRSKSESNNRTPPPSETIHQPTTEPYIAATQPPRPPHISTIRESTLSPKPSSSRPSTPSQQSSTLQWSNITPNRPPKCMDECSNSLVVDELEYPEHPTEMTVESSVDQWIYKKVRSRMLYPPHECPYIIHITLTELVQDFMSEFPAARSQEKLLFPNLLHKLQSANTFYHLRTSDGNIVITLIQRQSSKRSIIKDPITDNNVMPHKTDRASPPASHSTPSASHPAPSASHPVPPVSHPAPPASLPTPPASLPALSASHPAPSASHPTPPASLPAPPASLPAPPASLPAPSASHSTPATSHCNQPHCTEINSSHTMPCSTSSPTDSTNQNCFKSEFGVGSNFADFLDGETPSSLPPPIQPSPPKPLQKPRALIQQDELLVNISNHIDVPMTTSPTESVTAVTENVTAVPENVMVTENVTTVTENVTAVPENVTAVTENVTAVPENVTAVTDNITTVPENVTTIKEDKPKIIRTQSSSSSCISGEFVVCNKSESESSCVLVDHDSERISTVSSLSSLVHSQTDTSTDTALVNEMEDLSLDNRSDDSSTDSIFYLSNQPSDTSVGVTPDKKYLCVNCATPATIAVLGADMPTKYGIIKRVVDVWVRKNLPVFVVSPKLETVSQHKDVEFYAFKSLAGSADLEMVTASQEFLHSHDEMKLFVLNTSHKAVNTDDFLEWLLDEYYSLNTVVLSVCVPDPAVFTALLSSWKRCKNDEIWKGFVEDHELSEDVTPETIKRGSVLAYSLDGASLEPIVCKPC